MNFNEPTPTALEIAKDLVQKEAVVRKLEARVADLESVTRSLNIIIEHHKATVRALTHSGQYDAGKMEEGLDGQVLRELNGL